MALAKGEGGRNDPLSAELERLRGLLADDEDADRDAAEVLTHLADLTRKSVEVRRQTRRRVIEAVARCGELAGAQAETQRGLLASVLDEIATARARTGAVADARAKLDDVGGRPDPVIRPPPVASGLAPAVAEIRLGLIVEGVPSAAAALSLQRFIASRPPIRAADARAFARGELRLDITATDVPSIGDILGWDGGRLELVSRSPGSLTVRVVPPSDGAA